MATEIIDFKKNSLNTFRLLAAISVLWIHALNHLELADVPVLGPFIKFFTGVPIFFTLSGFLIWRSIGNSKSFVDYAKKRFWRIYPELWVAVAVEIIVLLILYHQPINWPQLGLFTIGQSTIFQFWTPEFLRGYGCGTPNGALWTIAILIQFYFLSYFIYKWMKNRRLMVWGGVILASIIVELIEHVIRAAFPPMISKLYGVTIIPYLWMFLPAAFAAEYKDMILPFLKRYWWLFITVLLVKKYVFHWDIAMNTYYGLFDTILIFCGIVGFAYKFPMLTVKTDISYGVYIYHMTIINALMAFGFVGQPWTLWATLLGSCLIAWLSTMTVGRVSTKKKQSVPCIREA